MVEAYGEDWGDEWDNTDGQEDDIMAVITEQDSKNSSGSFGE